MRRMMLLAGGVALTLALAAPAQAHDKQFKSRVTIKADNEFTWHGRVKSESPKCVADRHVKVFTENGKHLVTAVTDEDGKWQGGLLGERYYARVTRDVRGGPGHSHVCKPDRSPTVTAPPKPRRHVKKHETEVTIEHPSAAYEGDVISSSDACVRRRVVQFWFDNTAGPDELIDEGPASRDGHWSFEFAGTLYYAKVKRVVKTPGQHRHVCKGDRSPSIS